MKNEKARKILIELLVVVLLLAVFVAPRVIDLDRTVTIDEGLWMYHSSQFYYAVGQREFENTLQRFHPGVTMMWSGTLGFLAEFPEFRGIGQGYIDGGKKLSRFLVAQGESPLEILAASRVFMVAQNALIFLLAYWAARKLLPLATAAAVFALMSLEPFYVSLTQILQMDGLMATYMLASMLALLVYLCADSLKRRTNWLLLSGALAGGAVLTKAPAAFLLPYTGLMLLILMIEERDFSIGAILKKIGLPMLVWILAAAAVFIALWPAMWADPLGTMDQILFNSSDRLTQGLGFRLFFDGKTSYGNEYAWYFYPYSFAWRSSPVVLLGLIPAVVGYFKRWGLLGDKKARRVLIGMALAAFFFTIEMGLGALKMDRYIIPVHVALAVVSGMGWLALAQQVAAGKPWKGRMSWLKTRAAVIVLAVLVISQIGQLACTYPYYFAYYNPLFGGTEAAEDMFWLGWGEGLEEVGAYLSPMHDANKMKVMSLHALGPLSYYFHGKVINKPWPGPVSYPDVENLDYMVIYVSERQTNHDPAVLEVLGGLEPELVVPINGVEYARLYNMADIPPEGWAYLRQELPVGPSQPLEDE